MQPDQERLRQRVSLDYEKLEQIKRRRQQSKASPAPQEQILNLVQQLQQKLPQVNQTRDIVTKTPRIAHQLLQTMSAATHSSQQSPRNVSPPKQAAANEGLPQNYIYPDTNTRLTCNYFGSNDYTRKMTIEDIRDQVVE